MSFALDATAQERTFHLDSRPSGATIYINGRESGTTPYEYSYVRVAEPLTFELRMEGYRPRTVDLNTVLKDQHSSKRPLTVDLYRDFGADIQRFDLPMTQLIISMDLAKAPMGKVGPRKLTADSREFEDLSSPEALNANINHALQNTYVHAYTVQRGTQKGDEAIARAKVYVQPVLKDLLFSAEQFDHVDYGTLELHMEWRFMSGVDTDSMLFSIEKRSVYNIFEEREGYALPKAFRDAAHRMIEEDGLHDRLKRVFSEGLVRSKGSVIELVRPKPITFSGRKDMLTSLVKGVVTIRTKDGHGSGFIIGNEGYIITNAHVVGDQAGVAVKFNQGFTLDGQVVKVNRDFDLALIKTPGSDMPALELGDDMQLLVGEELFAIGTPLAEELGQTVTRGILSGRREFEGRYFLQTDVSINSGNSGGPLIDETGKVVGVTTMKLREGGAQGIGFAVPVSKMLEMLNITIVDP
jgi:S1-C subfamily serine protease